MNVRGVRVYEFPVVSERVRIAGGASVSAGGKSELRRAGCRVTPGRREATESATESIPPMAAVRRVHR